MKHLGRNHHIYVLEPQAVPAITIESGEELMVETWDAFLGERDPLVDRMWTMQRSFMYRDMATVGVDIIGWPAGTTLDQAMTLVPDRRRR